MANSAHIVTRQDKILSTPFIQLLLLSACVSSVSYMANTIISDYTTRILGTTISLAGTIASIASMGALLITPFTGPAANRLDKKKLLQAATILFTLAASGYAFCKNIPLLMGFCLLAGIGNGISATAGMVMVTEILPNERMTEGVGYYGLANIFMQAVGPSASVMIVNKFGHSASFIIAGVIAFVGFIISLKLPNSPPPVDTVEKKLSLKSLLKETVAKESLLPAAIGFCFALINGIQMAFIIPYSKVIGLPNGGAYFVAISVAMVGARLFFGKITQRRSVAFTVVFSGIFIIMCPILLGFGKSQTTMMLAGVLFGVGYGTLLPVTQSTAVKFAPPNRKGSGSSTYFMGIMLAFAVGPAISGFIAQGYGYSKMFLTLVVPSLLGITLGIVKGNIPVNPDSVNRNVVRYRTR